MQKGSSNAIHLFAFADASKLMRMMAHELGHAMGLNHVSDPNAIMYAVNQGDTLIITDADKAEFQHTCGP